MKKLLRGLSILLSLVVIFGIVSQAQIVNAETKKVRTITIGTGNAFKPYCYLDEKGQLQGYEKEVLTAVFKKLPQYTIKFKTSEFKNVLLSLASQKIDLAAHQFEVNPERKQKFLYGDESYTTFILRIVVKKDNQTVKGIEDLKGKKVQIGQGSNDAYVLEKYNKDHPDKAVKLVYSSADQATTVKNLQDGKIDAFISITRIVESLNKTFGNVIKTVGEPIATSSTYYIFRKEDKQLKEDVDKVLKQLRTDGTLSKISIKILGGDYTSND